MVDEGTQQPFSALARSGIATRRRRQASHFPARIVGHGVSFEVVPNVLHGIEFGGICRQEDEAHGRRAGQKHPNPLRPVDLPPVPDHEEGCALELPGKLPQEREHPLCIDVGCRVQPETASDSMALG